MSNNINIMINKRLVQQKPLAEFLFSRNKQSRHGVDSFNTLMLEITARCNLKCTHCYINQPLEDTQTASAELSLSELIHIIDEAVSLGALECIITGGEPLIRTDFLDIYYYAKKKGLLVTIFTNATLITEEHVSIFKKYPPRNIEITVYGATRETYEQVTDQKGSFSAFIHGLDLLRKERIRVVLKAMILRSNLQEFNQIASFCKAYSSDSFRFDTFLQLRLDRDCKRNLIIQKERLSVKEIVDLERKNKERVDILKKRYYKSLITPISYRNQSCIFPCHIYTGRTVGHDGFLRLCVSLSHPDYKHDLKIKKFTDAYKKSIVQIKVAQSKRVEFLERCGRCRFLSFCFWCPAHAYLETGIMDMPVDYFCKVAHARIKMLRRSLA